MTCIVAIETSDNNVILAGDYLGSDNFTKAVFTQSKIFNHSGMMFGYTSSFRFGQILECILDDNTIYPPCNPDSTYEWLIRTFIPKLKSTLKTEESPCGEAIIVINSQVWQLQGDFSVLRSTLGICSVGSGSYHATASVLSLILSECSGSLPSTEEAKRIIDITYKVTSTCVTSVSEKYNILEFKDLE